MPLMGAHAEYVKLLRSIRDSPVFDRTIVAERYLNKRGRTDLEVWKLTHRTQIPKHLSYCIGAP
jgi:glucoamylase